MTPKGGVAKVTCPTFEAMGQIPMFHRTYFLLSPSSSKFLLFGQQSVILCRVTRLRQDKLQTIGLVVSRAALNAHTVGK